MSARVLSVNISYRKGLKKFKVPSALLLEDHGIVGDAHAGSWHRQISMLGMESIDKVRKQGLDVDSGDFAENITTIGLELGTVTVGTLVKIGEAIVQVTQIGKECHDRCGIYDQIGDCVMPKEGIFARVLRGGTVMAGDDVNILTSDHHQQLI
jgi:MOSC domain-containing protein YiiM